MSDWLQGDSLPDVGAPLVGDGGQFSAGVPAVNNAADVASKVAYGMGTQVATLPQRAIQNSQFSLDTGNYDPSAPLEAAMLPMGTGAVAGVPVRGGEAVFGSGFVDKLYHGSETPGIAELNASERGPLGPGTYATPFKPVADRYAGASGTTYELPDKSRDVFNGLGDRYGSGYEGWKADKDRLLQAAEPDKRQAVSDILDKSWMSDGYPMYAQLRNLYGGHEGAQALFKKAGFEGIGGHVDGPEVVLFGNQPLKSGPKLAAAGGVAAGSAAFLQGSNDPAKAEEASQQPVQPQAFDMGGYLSGIRNGESGNNYQSGTPGTSSASGAYQFIGSTWQQFKPPGAPNDPAAATPAQQDQAAAAFTTRNAKVLQGAGIAPDPLTLSIAHQQGASVAVALSKAQPDALAKDFAPPAGVANNRPFFFNKDGTPMTVAQSKAKFADFYQAGSGGAPAAPAPAARAPSKLQQVADFLHGTNAPPPAGQQQPATQQEPEPLPFEAPFSPASPVSTAARGKGGKVYLQRYGRTYDDTGKQVG